MQINPDTIIARKILIPSEYTEVQQVGIDLSLKENIEIPHGSSINVDFNETIKLPKDVYSDFKQRSSLSRKGLFCTTGIYDPGYEGSCGCTIYNLSGKTVAFAAGDRVGQMLFYKGQAASEYSGQWQGK